MFSVLFRRKGKVEGEGSTAPVRRKARTSRSLLRVRDRNEKAKCGARTRRRTRMRRTQLGRLMVRDEFLEAFADDVAEVNVAPGIKGDGMEPIEFARLFMVILTLGQRP